MIPIILASGSKNRQTILKSINIPFQIVVSNFDEKNVREKNLSVRAKKLARLKGEVVYKSNRGIIISADTFTGCQGKVLEKPGNRAEATNMLIFLSGKKAVNYTGFYYQDPDKKITVSKTFQTKIQFRHFYENEIEDYVNKFPVTRWAGAYAASELYVMGMIAVVSGSLTGLTHGLPMECLIPLLIRSGFHSTP